MGVQPGPDVDVPRAPDNANGQPVPGNSDGKGGLNLGEEEEEEGVVEGPAIEAFVVLSCHPGMSNPSHPSGYSAHLSGSKLLVIHGLLMH